MLRKNSSSLFIFFIGLFSLLVLSFFIRGVYFPGDILNYFPLFSENSWQRPHNSLLADPVFQFEPWRYFAKTNLFSGKIPLWNDLNGLGVPFLANPQTALFFPLTIFFFFLPLVSGQFFIHAAKVFIFLFFTYQYLRSIRLGKRASILGAMAASSSAFFTTWLLWPHTNVFMFLPILLLIIKKITIVKKKTYLYILFSLCTALAYFGGHPETLLQIGVVVIGYIFFRLYPLRRIFIKTLFFGLIGIQLTSIQLIPFLEYLFHSTAWISRTGFSSFQSLPFSSAILNIFPFLLGAPHLRFYKAIEGTSFQESAGGYVGFVMVILAVVAIIAQIKQKTVVFWGVVGVFAFSMAYSIPPISLINFLPVFEKAANQRFLGILGYSVIILGSWMIDIILKKKTQYKLSGFYMLGTMGIGLVLPVLFLPQIIRFFGLYPPHAFETQLQNHLLLQIVSTVCFFVVLLYFKSSKAIQFALLIVFLFLQTGFLFWNYVPFIPEKKYYTKVELVQEVQKLSQGTYMEVGNPSIKENINLVYGLSSIESYDAMDIDTYKKSFDRFFPIKNHWENVDRVSEQSLKQFGVRYILSDYDLRLLPDAIEKDMYRLLPPLTTNFEYRIQFQPKKSTLAGIRFLTANFNRRNTCSFTVSVSDGLTDLYKAEQLCTNVRDKMYFFVPLPDILVDTGRTYDILFKSNGSKENSIALWGGERPYLQLFYSFTGHQYLTFNTYKNNTFLFEYRKASPISFSGRYKILEKSNQELLLKTSHVRESSLQVKIPYYPGWKVTVDREPIPIKASDALMSFTVPAGSHIIKIYYSPISFLLGLIISGITLLLLSLFFLRNLIQERFITQFLNKWMRFAKKSREIYWWKHIVILLVGLLIAIAILIIFFKNVHLRLTVPSTSVINWLSVNNYPKQQDYLLLYACFIFILFFAAIFWLTILWIKKR